MMCVTASLITRHTFAPRASRLGELNNAISACTQSAVLIKDILNTQLIVPGLTESVLTIFPTSSTLLRFDEVSDQPSMPADCNWIRPLSNAQQFCCMSASFRTWYV